MLELVITGNKISAPEKAMQEIQALISQQKALEEQLNQVKNQIKDAMFEAGVSKWDNKYFTASLSKSPKQIDESALRAFFPEAYEKCCVQVLDKALLKDRFPAIYDDCLVDTNRPGSFRLNSK